MDFLNLVLGISTDPARVRLALLRYSSFEPVTPSTGRTCTPGSGSIEIGLLEGGQGEVAGVEPVQEGVRLQGPGHRQ